MHKDSKEQRRIFSEMTQRRSMPAKYPNQNAMKSFKEVPYQLRYRREQEND